LRKNIDRKHRRGGRNPEKEKRCGKGTATAISVIKS